MSLRSPLPERPLAEAARRRGRPPVITTERLLAIAREVFLERGIRATTAEVAARARVSEGTVFHRFGSKDALFRAAMGFDPTNEPLALTSLAARAGKGDLRHTLTDAADELLAFGRVALPVMMMSWSNPTGEYALEKLVDQPHLKPIRIVERLRDFFAAEQKHGRIRPGDPMVLARIFAGSLHHYCMTEIFRPRRDGLPAPGIYVRGLVDLVLRGAETPRKSPTKGRRR